MVSVKNAKRESEKISLSRERPVEKIEKVEKIKVVQKKERERIREEENDIDIPREKSPRSKYGLWFVAGVAVLFFIFALSYLFARAEVTINPRIKDFTLDKSFSAIKDSNPDGLSFDLVVISGDENKSISATLTKDVAYKAEGTVVIYNTFSSAPQKFLIDTRLEGSNGKIYKTKTALTVPGVAADGTPGSVESRIYGEAAGPEYNSAPLDFKIFGFKGTPKYAKFFAKSKGAITGGFKGQAPVVTDELKASTLAELRTSLKEKLFEKAINQIPSGFVLFKDAVFLNIDEENVDLAATGGSLPISVKGTMYGFLFNEKNLTAKIAKDNIPDYDDSEVYIPNIRDLAFSLDTKDISYADVQNINFHLSGSAKVVWKFDSDKITSELLGKSKKDFDGILSQYPNIDSAQLTLSPFWITSFPSKSKDIKVIVNYPK